MDNKKEKPNTINNINKSIGQGGIFSENDPIDVNNLLTLADSDITPDLLMQLEQRAKEEQDKMNLTEKKEEKENPLQENIQIPEGLPAENGAVERDSVKKAAKSRLFCTFSENHTILMAGGALWKHVFGWPWRRPWALGW